MTTDKHDDGGSVPEVQPWHDCPPCPKCGLSVGVGGRCAGWLSCPACGHSWCGTEAEIAQAAKADAAWEAELDRQAAAEKRRREEGA